NHQIISLFGLVWSVIYQKVDLSWTYFSAQTSFPDLPWSWDSYSFD
ncbi:3172_t:CDS:1, partial [Dentiscutata heterogama]